MGFSWKEAGSGLRHLALGWKRQLSNTDSQHYVPLLMQNLPGCRVTVEPQVCHICGFARVEVELENGWLLQACSAGQVRKLAGSDKFKHWRSTLPARQTAIQSLTK